MQRKISTQYIRTIASGESKLLSEIHHGLEEAPFHEVYPYLNVAELFSFASQTWMDRKQERIELRGEHYSYDEYIGVDSDVDRDKSPGV